MSESAPKRPKRFSTELRSRPLRVTLVRVGNFVWRVLKRFKANKGLLLAGAVAYNTMLSVVPLFAVLMVGLSHVTDEQMLLDIVQAELELIAPNQALTLRNEISSFLQHRDLLGVAGLAVLLFFSSLAFRILEDAFSLIFYQHAPKNKRGFWVSATMPYLYIATIGLGLMLLTFFTAGIEGIAGRDVTALGFVFSFEGAPGLWLKVVGFASQVLMFTSIYMVMPTISIAFRRALVGGVIAAVLWEVTRYIMTWYFTNLSLVNVVYGSLATVIIVLLSMEAASIILLLGAQVIAELERNAEERLPWFQDPEGLA